MPTRICSRLLRTPGAIADGNGVRPHKAAGSPMEAMMIGTVLVILAAVVIAVLGCGWVGQIDVGREDRSTRRHRT
jgi:hypothetical protein